MPSLTEVLHDTSLRPEDLEWLHLLVGDWQLVADLSFADLVLWVRRDEDTWVAAAHVRPTTGPTAFVDDHVGQAATPERVVLLGQAVAGRRIVRSTHAERGDQVLREDAVPVMPKGRIIAVLTRHTNLATMRAPSRLELTYLACADALVRMTRVGEYPFASAPTGLRRGAPRVGDGLLRLDAEGQIVYASPNAVSAIHRMGHPGPVSGQSLAAIVTGVLRERQVLDEALPLVLTGRQPWRTDVSSRAAEISLRAVPLIEAGERVGAVVLLRDVSELRRREQQLLTREATIREIHHRVKNNLQSVAALLRLQSRRMANPDARAALDEAVRRVSTIAVVHDTLSQSVDETVALDAIIDLAVSAVLDVAAAGTPVQARRTGSFGRVRAEDATALAMIVSELVQNAVEHGLGAGGGAVGIDARRGVDDEGEFIVVTVDDDGYGLPDHPVGRSGLGMLIVRSLASDLEGTVTWGPRALGGTSVVCRARLRPLPKGA
ncbi:MAG: histidine kinase N-terminal domain-containing protein [Actinomycetales bacterium]|nr:histidine kinase N-terminal domain-containing protein [Candidatus Lutibacillus vidarii]